MTIKKICSHDLRSAVQKVRNELGRNAVVLSHRRITRGIIEVIAVPKSRHDTVARYDDAGADIAVPLEPSFTFFSDISSGYKRPIGKTYYYDGREPHCRDKARNFSDNSSGGNESCTDHCHRHEPRLHKDRVRNTSGTQAGIGDRRQSEKILFHDSTQELTDYASMDKVVLNSYHTNSSDESKAPTLENRVDAKTASGLVEQLIIEQAWGAKARQNPDKARLLRQLLKLDINHRVIQKITDVLAGSEFNIKTALPHALALLSNELPIYKEDVTACGGTVALLGATGVGKTTAIAKMAARFALRQGRNNVALVSTDGNRIAGAEQLRIYGKLLGIPLKVVSDDIELLDALNVFSDKAFVLIDTAGMGPNDVICSRYFDLFSGGITQIKNFLVLPATAHRNVLEETAQAFGHLKLDGSIITKVDETTRLGGPLSVAIVNDLPVAYFSDGQKIPDDFHPARAHTLISRAVSVIDQFDDAQPISATEHSSAGVEANVCI